MVIDTSQERVFPSDARNVSVSRLGGRVSCPSFSPSEDVAAPVGPHGLSGMVSSQWSQLRDLWSPMSDASSLLVPLSLECGGSRRKVSSGHSPSRLVLLCFCTQLPLCQAGGPISLIWWVRGLVSGEEESLLHINVLEMRAVVLVLDAFLLQLSWQSVVLMSDNATIVAYLRNQGGHCLAGDVPHGQQDSSVD